MALRLEDYALVGDCHTAALVGRNGAVDWLCLPDFDGDACLAALLGAEEHGSWQIAPAGEVKRATQRYRDATLILETEFETAQGRVRLTDFMPIRNGPPCFVRLVSGLAGRVPMRQTLAPRFGYGQIKPWIERCDGARAVQALAGPDKLVLRAGAPLDCCPDRITADFAVAAGAVVPFVLSYALSSAATPAAIAPERALAETEAWWRDWAAGARRPNRWPEAVLRSLITLKALTYRPTGAVVAAPTAALPEEIGGKLNWDYRFCWLRDASFTMSALLNAGFHEEATAWRDWLLRAVGGSPEHLQVMYRLHGGRHIPEWRADWLPGYENSAPVHIGNEASRQRQLDIYGELLCALRLAADCGVPMSEHALATEARLIRHLASIWQLPDKGMWESRGAPRQFTYSKVMAWAGFDRVLRGAAAGQLDQAEIARLAELRVRIHEEVCRRAFDAPSGSLVRSYESYSVDAALLRAPMVDFLPVSDRRMRATIARIRRELDDHGFIRRFKSDFADERESHGEGAFLACSLWMAECLHRLGERAAACELFERVLGVRSTLGLLSEEYDTGRKRLVGNYPLALTHVALVNAAFTLSESG